MGSFKDMLGEMIGNTDALQKKSQEMSQQLATLQCDDVGGLLAVVERTDAIFMLSGPVIKDMLFFSAIYNVRNVVQGDAVATAFRYDRQKTTDPFWGGKVDFVPFDFSMSRRCWPVQPMWI